jgi:simple sugar transport system ATP-binding protein
VLTPQEVADFFRILAPMREDGKAVVIITHKLDEVLAISDEVTVMRDGRVVGHGKTKDTNAAELARLMVGRDVLLRVNKPPAHPGAAILRVENLSMTAADGTLRLASISFEVKTGEIVGIAGVEGNGQTELIEALAGLVEPRQLSGRLWFDGANITQKTARQRKEMGIAHVPEDRHRRGLLLDSDLADNSILGVHFQPPAVVPPARIMLDEAGIRRRAQEVIRDFDVRPPNPALAARALSGGNQQKLVIGREFELPPKLLLVSQPTRGVDIGAIEFIHRKLVELRDSGCAILLVSAELEEVTALADRLLVIYHGKIAGEREPGRTSIEEIGLMMTGGYA